MKKIIGIFVLLAFTAFSFAQGDYEAFRFTQTEISGTARFMGAGGAFSTTGGEFSALSLNPAAIGLYKRHEVTLTPMSLAFSNNTSKYYGTNTFAKNPKYTVPECGLVINSKIENSNWKSWQFGFGYNRIMDFNNTFRADAQNVNNSMVNAVLRHAQGTPYTALAGDAGLFWSTWAIDTFPNQPDHYYSPFENAELNHSALVEQFGAIDEISLAFGGNFQDKLYIGASLGIPIIDYKERITYSEALSNDLEVGDYLTSFQTVATQRDAGGGINLKLGIIYQPVSFLRIGAGFQTPTYYWKIKDTYDREMLAQYYDGTNSKTWSYTNRNNFTLTTPLKFNIGATFLIKKHAFISAEYNFCDFGMANLYSNEYNYTTENQAVKDKYGICHTLRVGAEVNLAPQFALRAGYNFKSSPYKLTSGPYNGSAHYASVGLGFKSKYFFADLAYVLKLSKDSFWLYEGNDPAVSAVEYENSTHRIVATIGCKF
ncbi:MAG: hypothetical protein IJK85_03920 [Bacteroidales bacterium]|nr:hypothetical protein [Bacteroidales bacterium]